jgi:hypothetical protein
MATQNSSGKSVGAYPVATSFGLLVLAALIGLAVLRHFAGTISVQVGR